METCPNCGERDEEFDELHRTPVGKVCYWCYLDVKFHEEDGDTPAAERISKSQRNGPYSQLICEYCSGVEFRVFSGNYSTVVECVTCENSDREIHEG